MYTHDDSHDKKGRCTAHSRIAISLFSSSLLNRRLKPRLFIVPTKAVQVRQTAMALEKEWLEVILKKNHFEDSPQFLVDVKSSEAVGKWENYFSKIERISAKVILGSGRYKTMSIIMKNRHTSARLKEITIRNGFFVRETAMYQDILPKMEELLDEFGETDGILWARCYGARLYDKLVLEDLSVSGYEVANRLELMDLQMSQFVMTRLAKFHALSHVLLERSAIPLAVVGKSIWHTGDGIARMSARYTASLLKEMANWGEEWEDATQRLKAAEPGFSTRYIGALDCEPNDFRVLNHGDCWTNNMMFKFEQGSGQPSDLKFIDWQASFVGHPADDLHKFFITSVKPDILENHIDDLLASYCDSLRRHLSKLGRDAKIGPNPAELRRLLDRTFVLRLGDAIIFTANVAGEHDGLPDFEETIIQEAQADSTGGASFWDAHSRLTPNAKSLIQLAIKESINLNVI